MQLVRIYIILYLNMDRSAKTMDGNNVTMEELRLSDLMDADLSRHDLTEDSMRISDESVRMHRDGARISEDTMRRYEDQDEYLGETIVAGSSDMVHPHHTHNAGDRHHRQHGQKGIIVQSSPIKKQHKSKEQRDSHSSHSHNQSCHHLNGHGMQPYLEMREKGSTGSRDSTLSRNLYQAYQGEFLITQEQNIILMISAKCYTLATLTKNSCFRGYHEGKAFVPCPTRPWLGSLTL